MSAAKITDEQLIAEREAGLKLREIAEKYGMSLRQVEHRHSKLAKRGEISTIGSPGFAVIGESKLVDKDGNTKLTWIKTHKDKEQLEAIMQAAMAAFSEEVPRIKPHDEKLLITRKRWRYIRSLISILAQWLISMKAVRITTLQRRKT
ncbi:DNA repair exonuclease [Salmonella phage 36]|uniref:Host specificity protein n=1 Tax=Salmonella phage 36 TaxID=1654889 RepID=A0A0N6WGC7_9CAUD|nr:DNA repair exonuclease [Salmonella phage 36]AKJ74049.1 host specificity protein [Salmonella phage 36]